MTWELYERMKAWKASLTKASNRFPRKFNSEEERAKAQQLRFRIINEVASINKWLREAEAKLSFIVKGDAEFSHMARSKYFNLLPYDPEVQRKVLEWIDYIEKSRDPKLRWIMTKADPEKHRALKEKRRINAQLKRI